jgi:uncharacterized protein (DUF58 family)
MKVITVHRSGMIYIVVSIIMGLLAINGGNNFHYLAASAILGYMLASGVAGRRNIRGTSVSLSFPDEIYALTPFFLTVEVHNSGRVPIFLIEVAVGDAKTWFPVIQPGETSRKTVMFTISSRGLCGIDGIELSSPYPFNFFTRYWPVSFDGRATVFPSPISLRPGDFRIWTDSEMDAGRSQKPDCESDIVGVRPYAEGDPMKMIHWKSSARTGRLNSKLYESDGDAAARMIDLDSLVSRGLEAGLSIASHEISEAIKSGRSIGMVDRGAVWAASPVRADKLSMLTSLALYE